MTSSDGTTLPLLLLAGFQSLVDELNTWLAEQGHPDVRPMHGFALQAIGDGATTAELGRRLGVSKQAAAKTVAAMEERGYVERAPDPVDARRVIVRVGPLGREVLALSVRGFVLQRARWVETLGERRVSAIERDLARVVPVQLRLDAPSWFSR